MLCGPPDSLLAGKIISFECCSSRRCPLGAGMPDLVFNVAIYNEAAVRAAKLHLCVHHANDKRASLCILQNNAKESENPLLFHNFSDNHCLCM